VTLVTKRSRLAAHPRLYAGYLGWRNRPRRIKRACAAAVAYLAVVLAGCAALLMHGARAGACFHLLQIHPVMIGMIGMMVSTVWISARRAEDLSEASRTWTSALPVAAHARRTETLVFAAGPALVCGTVALVSAAMLGAAAAAARMSPAPFAPAAATLLGLLGGLALSFAIPRSKGRLEYEGSRYVPARRIAVSSEPRASLAPLAIWPIRHLFASARPRLISRSLIPVLLSVGIGATASDVMLVVGMVGALAAIVVLIFAVGEVTSAAWWYVQSTSLGVRRLSRTVLSRVPFAIAIAGALAAWFWYLLGEPTVPAVSGGLWLIALGTAAAGVCSIRAQYKLNKSRRDTSSTTA
jgi:hypothetical protein